MAENQNQQLQTTKQFLESKGIQDKFHQLLGAKSKGFITSVMQIVSSNKYLQKADPVSIYQAAATAAILDLPINNNLGYAWIVPYNNQAQFQIGWKGLVQLAQRTAQYLRINATEVYANQFVGYNELTEELNADFSKEGEGDIVGYVAYFKLINGFEKTVYWSKKKVIRHATKYSKAYTGSGPSPWKDADQFHEMAKKTVLKNMLSKWGILSIEMERAIVSDQAVVKDFDTMDVEYPDAMEEEETSSEEQRALKMITLAATAEQLEMIEGDVRQYAPDAYDKRLDELRKAEKSK